MEYKMTKNYRFYGDEYYDDDVYGRNRIREKSIVLKDVPLHYGEIDWNELIDLITGKEYAYAVTSKDHCEVNSNGDTLH